MFRAYVIIFIVHLCFIFQGCATSEHLEAGLRDIERFKMTKEKMWDEIQRLKIKNSNLERQIGVLENENQRMRDQNELLNKQINKSKEENKRISDEDRAFGQRLTVLQLKHETPSSRPYEPEKEGYEIESMYVQKRSVRVRGGPGIDYRAVGARRLGDRVFTKDSEGDWYRIVDPGKSNKTIGWIHGSLLGKMPPGQ